MNQQGTRRLLCAILSILLLVSAFPASAAEEPLPEALSAAAAQAGLAAGQQVRAIVVLNDAQSQQTVLEGMDRLDISYRLAHVFDTLLNGFSCDVAYGDLTAIAGLNGVAQVHIANHYAQPEPETPPSSSAPTQGATLMSVSNDDITTSQEALANGYSGKGMVIAVLDTGFRVDHEVFAAYPDQLGTPALTQTFVEEAIANQTVSAGQYVSPKLPFVFDYAGNASGDEPDSDVSNTDGHGTSVASVAAGYAESAPGVVKFSGSAPGAQILGMKVFHDGQGGGTTDIYFAALEDAAKLGADVINISFGVPSGLTYDTALDGAMGNIFQKLRQQGIVVCVAAGNSYSMKSQLNQQLLTPGYTDYGNLYNPASYEGNIAVASRKNNLNGTTGTMDDFSSWGCVPNLTIKPQLTSVGGEVNVAMSDTASSYGNSGGTSLASPNLGGALLCVMAYLRNDPSGPRLRKPEAARTAELLLESTASPQTSEVQNGTVASPRKQGAGLALTMKAINAYKSGLWIQDPLQNVGHDPDETGVYTYETTLVNQSASSVTYTPTALVMTDHLAENGDGTPVNTLSSEYLFNSMTAENTVTQDAKAAVTCSVDGQPVSAITLPANSSTAVTVAVTLTDAGKSALRAAFPNGAYVEGYVTFTPAVSSLPTLHSTYLAYFGSWAASPAVQPYDNRDYLSHIFFDDSTNPASAFPQLMMGFNLAKTSNGSGYHTLAGDIPSNYSTNHTDADGNRLVYSAERAAMSSGANSRSRFITLYPSLLRGVRQLRLTASDKNDPTQIYGRSEVNYAARAFSNNDRTVWTPSTGISWDASSASLADGTVVHLSLDAQMWYLDDTDPVIQEDIWSFDVTIDNQSPTMEHAEYDSENHKLYVTLHDNQYVAAVNVLSGGGYIDESHRFSPEAPDQDVVAVFDTTDWPANSPISFYVTDYAYNEHYFSLNLSTCDPVVPSVQLSDISSDRMVLALQHIPDCKLLVAAYAQNRMVDAVLTAVDAGDTSATLTFRQTLTPDLTLRAFVLDDADYHPLIPAPDLR